jgi:hypothetical protein
MEEWNQTREVLELFDDRIHDLRKYGFSFITGIMALQGFLLPFVPASPSREASGLPDAAKFSALLATTFLIIAIRWFDGHYQGFQHGAAIRSQRGTDSFGSKKC